MPTAEGMSQVIPCHVLRVGQTICVDSSQENVPHPPDLSKPNCQLDDCDLDMTLDNLNQLMLDLDPTFEPIQVNKSPTCPTPQTDSFCAKDSDGPSHCVLIPRGCPPSSSSAVSPSIPIPTTSSLRCSPNGALVFSNSPTSYLPPLPFGSAPRRNHSPKNDIACSPGSLRLSSSTRNSATSLLSMSTCSDTSYIMGSNLSLAEDADFPDSIPACTPGSFNDGSRCHPFDNRPSLTKPGRLHGLHSTEARSSPASLAGSQTDIPLLLVNGAPQLDLHISGSEPDIQKIPASPSKRKCFQTTFSSSQPSMKFVMDTSKFWFRPHISRAEAEMLLKDKEAGAFLVRDSTSYRGSFGLAMKVEQSPTTLIAAAEPAESGSDVIRHFLIESSAKGVRIKGSSREPYFGSLPALVYQHTITPYALPCRLLLNDQDLEEKENEKTEDKSKTACNFVYLNAVPTEMLTGPCAVHRAVSSTLEKKPGTFAPTIVNMKVSLKGVTLTDINRKLFFRRHYPAYLLSYSGEDPDNRLWYKGTHFGARMFGFVAKGVEAGMENICHVFAECDPLQPCSKAVEFIQAAITKQETTKS
ncbi:tensin-4-like isoform X1 [Cyprinodon tularosa]|uniref:tensin-4-like isoform X1 n=1 Tax=Cyprinodon tularosa TaxID=77115 RepID=UPI0018E27846|nr:tensin-4-like isoform X1 [Cyprinodon tularosa]